MAPLNASTHDLEKGSAFDSIHSVQLTPGPEHKCPEVAPSRKFGNPSPLGVIGFTVCLSATSCILLGWARSDPSSMIAMVGPYYYIGGICLFVTGIMEWALGNTFNFVVFMIFGGYWSGLGTLNDPSMGIASAFAKTGGGASPELNSALMFYNAFFAALVVVLFIGTLRANIAFAALFFAVFIILVLFVIGYAKIVAGNLESATKLFKAAGVFSLATSAGSYYIFLSLICAAVDMPFTLPLGDLSGFLAKRKHE
ncbi:hypothetical protein V5O48_013302 [Marasmius crinis-equi]|uniref:Uncharacterized protein n=1 Tax=Marasmius crinis-equi TaxID=585013 RepID=A0ABR3F0G8_9AGAR